MMTCDYARNPDFLLIIKGRGVHKQGFLLINENNMKIIPSMGAYFITKTEQYTRTNTHFKAFTQTNIVFTLSQKV